MYGPLVLGGLAEQMYTLLSDETELTEVIKPVEGILFCLPAVFFFFFLQSTLHSLLLPLPMLKINCFPQESPTHSRQE